MRRGVQDRGDGQDHYRILTRSDLHAVGVGDPEPPGAAERVRRVLSSRGDVVEKKMVGGLSFLVNGNMCCGITGTALMVRVGAEHREQAIREPHVQPIAFAGRALSGFICIEPEGYAADDALASWVQRGLEFVSGLPAKPVRTS